MGPLRSTPKLGRTSKLGLALTRGFHKPKVKIIGINDIEILSTSTFNRCGDTNNIFNLFYLFIPLDKEQ